ncbi:pyridoxal 5'-phosphate synthase glutaminase subunit PdxT [Haloplanus rubicundus]|uniref:Pyridoxal 5'-phosphate synthase subunit PdxT n=1 Tax=Haloplanus rubicundus TaxID=1547898 RepID=A0A345EAR0_9EURY|nr:pyridoxal 5'-phosphate synthase glutaminase subunit PdxT [Haloplanus rubicundus]AXG05936.1 pyridoxal 5'-phosphate synthase glutaminase subunit PdxT [Haloplanus rubicundus]AXG09282.1 pyridoxal 5'-phosphate synthase glutaminase subunit PdxT [Haloplanus rubicundus]
MSRRIGVVAVQGNVSEHVDAIERAAAATDHAVEVVEIRESGVVPDCDALALPGGESTTISRLLRLEGIDDEIRDHAAAGKPILATCAGLIVAARDARDDRVDTLGLLDVSVDRNAFGRQVDSFEAGLDVEGLDDPFHAVFIRAPVVDEVGPDVDVLATWEDRPVAVAQGSVVATSFHPELTADDRLHRLALFDPLLADADVGAEA